LSVPDHLRGALAVPLALGGMLTAADAAAADTAAPTPTAPTEATAPAPDSTLPDVSVPLRDQTLSGNHVNQVDTTGQGNTTGDQTNTPADVPVNTAVQVSPTGGNSAGDQTNQTSGPVG
jgi:hypothetical protein